MELTALEAQTGKPAGNGLSPERAQELSRENQSGVRQWTGDKAVPAAADTSSSWLSMPSFSLPSLSLPSFLNFWPDHSQISDCSKDNCTVNGKQYLSSTDIPGNQPKPLLHNNGSPVIDPEGKPVVGPDRVDLDAVVANLKAQGGWFALHRTLPKFRHGGELDFQRMYTDNIPGSGARAIFSQPYQNFANVGMAYVLKGLGASADDVASYSDTYCWLRGCGYSEAKAEQYPRIAERQYRDFQIGAALYDERHP